MYHPVHESCRVLVGKTLKLCIIWSFNHDLQAIPVILHFYTWNHSTGYFLLCDLNSLRKYPSLKHRILRLAPPITDLTDHEASTTHLTSGSKRLPIACIHLYPDCILLKSPWVTEDLQAHLHCLLHLVKIFKNIEHSNIAYTIQDPALYDFSKIPVGNI